MKRLISFILCMLMLLSFVPATVLAADTENDTSTAYDLPEAGDKVNIVCTGKAEEAKIGGKNVKYNIHHDGEPYPHTIKFRKFAANNDKNYDPDIILYGYAVYVDDERHIRVEKTDEWNAAVGELYPDDARDCALLSELPRGEQEMILRYLEEQPTTPDWFKGRMAI